MAHSYRQFILIFACLGLLAAALSLSAADSRTYVIQNAKVYTLAAAGTLDRASIVVVDGKITQIGKTVKVPSGAKIIKADRARGLPRHG